MSSGLMSCVREHSPPLDLDFKNTPQISLHEYNTLPAGTSSHLVTNKTKTSTKTTLAMDDQGAIQNAEQKKRRFHPLRNLRRIFRRRTINSTTDSTLNPLTTQSSASEKNLRSATLTAIPKSVSASSPSSPLTQQQLNDAYISQSLPKSKSCGNGSDKLFRDALLNKNETQRVLRGESNENAKYTDMYSAAPIHTTTAYHASNTPLHHRQSVGVAVFPSAMGRNFVNERQKLRSICDSSQELGDSDNEDGHNTRTSHSNMSKDGAGARTGGGRTSVGEMSDSQRSLSEGLLVDRDYDYEGLSKSHDSVFSDSGTASSLSIVLKAELTDVLRKRRNRPDVSDEDLGLPHSPISPQRRNEKARNSNKLQSNVGIRSGNTTAKTGNNSDVSSISLLSINSHMGVAVQATSTANNSTVEERKTSSSYSTRSFTALPMPASETLRSPPNASFDETRDVIDFFSGDRQRLSHAAAKHKMAIRPTKKKVPSRLHRKTLEIRTTIPEGHEEMLNVKINELKHTTDQDTKKTRSLPPGVNAKIIDQFEFSNKLTDITDLDQSITRETNQADRYQLKKSKTLSSASYGENKGEDFDSRSFDSKLSFEELERSTISAVESKHVVQTNVIETVESGFLRRLMHRNSKRTVSKSGADEVAMEQSEPKKIQLSTSCIETKQTPNYSLPIKSRSSTTYEQNIEQTRKEIKREIVNESKSGVTALLNSYLFTGGSDKLTATTKDIVAVKPKSGPAARQRYMPKDIKTSNTIEKVECDKPSRKSYNEVFQSTSLVREISQSTKQHNTGSLSSIKSEHHYDKKPKIVGLSAFQQKVTRSTDSFVRTPSCNSMETSTDDPIDYYEEKQRRALEKSRSFRGCADEQKSNAVHSNMPSLPDLSLSFRVPSYLGEFLVTESSSPPTPPDGKCVSLGFEINDNNLMKILQTSADISKPSAFSSLASSDKQLLLNSGAAKDLPSPKLLPPVNVVPPRSPADSVNKNISEIEQNIDMIVKSSFISVVNKAAKSVDGITEEHNKSSDKANRLETVSCLKKTEKERPNILHLCDKVTNDVTITPTTAAVPLRGKAKVLTANADKKCKILERNSAPVTQTQTEIKSPKRPASVVTSTTKPVDSNVPEFLKIQLNRVDPDRVSRGPSVVLSKNVKQEVQTTPNTPTDSKGSGDDEHSTSSSTSFCINECIKKSETDNATQADLHEKLQAKTLNVKYKENESSAQAALPPMPSSLTIHDSPVKNKLAKQPHTPIVGEAIIKTTPLTSSELFKETSVKVSLQERKRAFLADESTKFERKSDTIINERKKLSPEDVSAKTANKCDESMKTQPSAHAIETTATDSGIIVFRRKSLNANAGNNMNATTNSNVCENDSTPELMKVFARRSLKVKDEDVQALTDKVCNGNIGPVAQVKKSIAATSIAKLQNNQMNIDSDKENQSASDEKLDQIPKSELTTMSPIAKNVTSNSNLATNNVSNRNSVSDFRNSIGKFTGRNNNNNNGSNTTLGSAKTNNLPALKTNCYRELKKDSNHDRNDTNKSTAKMERNNNVHMKIPAKANDPDARVSVPVTENSASKATKTIERSATIGEFKGIHQRRAEWEQRVKEAFK